MESLWKLLLTICVGALHAVVRTCCTPWGLLLKIITWYTTFPVTPHRICDRAFNYVLEKKKCCFSKGIKHSSGDICRQRNPFFLIICCCFPLLNKNATLFWPSVYMVLLDLTTIFQNWKGGKYAWKRLLLTASWGVTERLLLLFQRENTGRSLV